MARPYAHATSQLAAKQGQVDITLAQVITNNRSLGRESTRILIRLELYNVSKIRGLSGKYVPWAGMRWKHDVETPAEGDHFTQALDMFIAKYQADPRAMEAMLRGYEPEVVEE